MSDSRADALTLLGLEEIATPGEIESVYQSKRKALEERQQSAPTPALSDKFSGLLAKLEAAHKTLLDGETASHTAISAQASRRSASVLSQTKLDDLPGVAPEDISRLSFEAGQLLAGRYTIAELIGQGGMGAGYRAQDKNSGE
jgi:hypothetical protein